VGYNNRLANVKPTIVGLTTNPSVEYNILPADWPTEALGPIHLISISRCIILIIEMALAILV